MKNCSLFLLLNLFVSIALAEGTKALNLELPKDSEYQEKAPLRHSLRQKESCKILQQRLQFFRNNAELKEQSPVIVSSRTYADKRQYAVNPTIPQLYIGSKAPLNETYKKIQTDYDRQCR